MSEAAEIDDPPVSRTKMVIASTLAVPMFAAMGISALAWALVSVEREHYASALTCLAWGGRDPGLPGDGADHVAGPGRPGR